MKQSGRPSTWHQLPGMSLFELNSGDCGGGVTEVLIGSISLLDEFDVDIEGMRYQRLYGVL